METLQDEKIFSLDIGTRSVVGLILEQSGEQYRVIDLVVKEHKVRAMLDGQIHDISAVAEVISEVKATLESKHGPLTKVCVAAAGRSLKTEKAKAAVTISGKPMLSKEDILYLELTAVQQAQAIVAEKQAVEKSHFYYCVGYSVLHYFIDDEIIGNLIDQQGDKASVEIIATFLPRVVVDSLIKALERANLELEALTLEPIAAINVLVPLSMRRLNVALVDIGAGTSDIAITNTGTVIAYGMVPTAGDEITEAISDQLLLDFPVAEQAKRELWSHESITIQDILGFENDLSKTEVVNQILPSIDKLAREISQEIKQLNNGQSPKAVMLVGGGSMTPELPKRLAHMLDLPENRVAIRGAEAIQGLTFADDIPGGPENITPIGIAISARKSPIHYVTTTVNDRVVRMFEVKKLTIGDCLITSGILLNKLYGKPGMAIFITLNGEPLTIPGTYGEPPLLLKNGQECSIEDVVSDGDEISAQKGADGKQPQIRIKELLDIVPEKEIMINGKTFTLTTSIVKNNKKATLDDFIEDRDVIHVHFPKTIGELLQNPKLQEFSAMLMPFKIRFNGKETFLPMFSATILLNGHAAKETDSLSTNVELSIEKKVEPAVYNLASILNQLVTHSILVYFNNEPVTITKNISEFKRDGVLLNANDEIRPGDHIETNEKHDTDFIFQDIFKYIDVNKPENSTGNFTLMINKEEATFYSPIHNGDHLEINWAMSSKK